MALRSHNIPALLTQVARDLASERPTEESAAFVELVATETPWAEIFRHIDTISDFAVRHKLRNLELDYTVAFVRNEPVM